MSPKGRRGPWITCAFTLLTLRQSFALESQVSCDRDRSRLARSIISKYILPHAYWTSYDLPEECPLHPKQDICALSQSMPCMNVEWNICPATVKFSALESAKEQVSATKWKCGFCGSEHSTELALDQHLHSQHSDHVSEGGRQCLADLCDILHCDYIAEETLLRKQPGADPYARHAPCIPEKERQIKQKCKDVAELCFPVEAGPKAPQMWSFFNGHICYAHNCNDEVRNELLSTVVHAKAHINWGYSIFAGSITLILIGFYVIFWLYLRIFVGVMREDEFTSLRPSKRGGFWPFRQSNAKQS